MATSGHGGTYTEVDDVSRTLAVLGFYISVIGLASYTLKERAYMSDALIILLLGVAVGPIGWNLVNPGDWTDYNAELRDRITYEFARIVIGIQVLFTGIALPKAYLYHAWESLTTLLLLVMTLAWFMSAAFIYALLKYTAGITFLEALCIAACVTPTDPVLANSVVKGRFAEKHIPPHVRNIIAAESGANDGLGFPFIYLAIYLLGRTESHSSIGYEIGWWIVDVWLYQIALSCALGAIIGYLARKAVKYAEEKSLIDHESFLAIGVGLTFLTLGLCGMIGTDDILAAFVVGNSFTWDDYFRVRTEDESFQDVLDSLINVAIFLYIGALLPWSSFGDLAIGLSAWRLVVIGILIMLFRRLPWVLLLSKFIPDVVTWQEAVFTGWFGPIGVGAVYYAQVGLREIPEDRTRLREIIVPVVYFIVLCSVVVHGITIPIFKHTPKAFKLIRTRSLTLQGRSDLSTKFSKQPDQTSSVSMPSRSTAAHDGDLARSMEDGFAASGMASGATTPRTRAGTPTPTRAYAGSHVTWQDHAVALSDRRPAPDVDRTAETPHARENSGSSTDRPTERKLPSHMHEVPRSDTRPGQQLAFVEGDRVVTEGEDGRVHVTPIDAENQTPEQQA